MTSEFFDDDVNTPEQDLIQQLVEIEGFDNDMEMFEAYMTDSVCPGICVTPGCGYSCETEPDQTEGWCEECQKGTVKSAMILAGII